MPVIKPVAVSRHTQVNNILTLLLYFVLKITFRCIPKNNNNILLFTKLVLKVPTSVNSPGLRDNSK